MNIVLNKQFSQQYTVTENNTAKFMGSGDLDVLATPSIVAFMENAAKNYLNSFLTEDLGSVGSNININHIAPTLVGKKIIITGKITQVIKDKIIKRNFRKTGIRFINWNERDIRILNNAYSSYDEIQG